VSKAQRRRRAARPEQAWAEPPEVAEPAPQQRLIEHGEALRFGFQLLQSLPEKERAVFVLFELEQLPMSEIAAALECPVQTAYARLHRARERVRADVERASKRGELR
jgi:RNA polymerase sigma-70 factor (ECF subfamily)